MIQVVAYSDTDVILAADPERANFFVLTMESHLTTDIGDTLIGDFSGSGNLSNRVENRTKRRSVGMYLELWNSPLDTVINHFIALHESPTRIFAGSKSFISDAHDIADQLHREIIAS